MNGRAKGAAWALVLSTCVACSSTSSDAVSDPVKDCGNTTCGAKCYQRLQAWCAAK